MSVKIIHPVYYIAWRASCVQSTTKQKKTNDDDDDYDNTKATTSTTTTTMWRWRQATKTRSQGRQIIKFQFCILHFDIRLVCVPLITCNESTYEQLPVRMCIMHMPSTNFYNLIYVKSVSTISFSRTVALVHSLSFALSDSARLIS